MRARRAARVGGRHTALRSAPRRARLRPLRHVDRALRALPPWPSGRGSWVACVPAARLPPLSRRDLRDVRVGTPYLCGPGGSGVYRHRGGGAGGGDWVDVVGPDGRPRGGCHRGYLPTARVRGRVDVLGGGVRAPDARLGGGGAHVPTLARAAAVGRGHRRAIP